MSFVRNACVVLGAVAMPLSGCGGDQPVVQPPPPYMPPPPPTMTAPPPPPPAAMQAGPCDATTQLALQTAITARAHSEAGPGMQPESSSSFTCQVVPEGGVAQLPVTLQSGRCYTFIAHSLPNVSQVDVFLKPNFGPTPMPLLAAFASAPLAQSSDTGPAATIGKGQNCWKNPLPVQGPGLIEVKARTGAGPVAVQVYSRGF